MKSLGIDIGGTGIKGAIVDTKRGDFLSERIRILTPQPAKPKAVAKVVKELVKSFRWKGPIGSTFPAVIQHGVALTAANVDDSWIGVDAQALLQRTTGCPMVLLNDADAAGIAEMRFGAGRGQKGLVIILTLGTGVGSSLFIDGKLVPNTEFGHLQIRGKSAELRSSGRARQTQGYSWKQWGKKISEHLSHLERILRPDLFIIGGGVSKQHEEFFPYIKCRCKIVPAHLRNRAGIVGAALAASKLR